MSYLLFLSVLFSLLCAARSDNQPLSSAAEEAALYQLRSSLGLRAQDWPRKADPCTSWTGVVCQSGHVVALSLSGLRRTRLGRLDPRFDVDGIENLTRLASFNASGFALPGRIPDTLAGAAALSVISLPGCSVIGAIPQSLARLTNLTYLDLSSNNISGSLPDDLVVGLSRLQFLNLSHNNISSSLPDSLWRLPELKFLDVSVNNLTGELPAINSSSGSASDSIFNLSWNFYYGSIPSGFGSFLKRFSSVDLSGNYFDGDLVFDKLPYSSLVALNCFRNASQQRSYAKCKEFYEAKGIPYDAGHNSTTNGGNGSHKWKYILAGVLGGTALTLIVLVALYLCLRKCLGRATNQRAITGNAVPSGGIVAPLPVSPTAHLDMPAVGDEFTYDQLLKATSGFNNANLLKNGHSGDIYRGFIKNGIQVVVKRVDLQAVSKEAFTAELNFLAKHSSPRFVPFLGHCLENVNENEKLLIYKFMPYGDLSTALHKKPENVNEESCSLDWITRLKIAVGVAEALYYLHHENDPPLVHRDLRSSSILLDHKYEVRLGSLTEVCTQQVDSQPSVLSRILRSSTKSEQGSSGSSTANCSYDIYCMGEVLLELVTGRIGISGSNSDATYEWLENTLNCISFHDKELITTIVDPSLTVNEDHLEEVWAMAIVAKSCLSSRPSKRPTSKHILKALENPAKLVRQNSSNSAQLRPTSSRGSWHSAIVGSRRNSISDSISLGPIKDVRSLRRSATSKSQGSAGETSRSQRRSREIFPEPELVEDMV